MRTQTGRTRRRWTMSCRCVPERAGRGRGSSVPSPDPAGVDGVVILDLRLRADRYLLAPKAYAGCVLLLETSEEMPGAEYVYRVLLGMGETRHARGVRCGGGGAYQQFSVWTSATLTRTS